jgi:hypothetical protein
MVARTINVFLLGSWLIALLFVSEHAHGLQETQINSEINIYSAYENQPLEGTITITHDTSAPIEADSFTMDGAKIKVDPVKTVKISPNLELAIYNFTLPGKPKGLYMLPAISVKIGGKSYQSVASSYEVMDAQSNPSSPKEPSAPSEPSSPSVTSQQAPPPATLILKAEVNGTNPLYPGQRAWLVYKFYFKGSIALTTETLPLLDAKGFEKVGDKQIKNYQENGLDVQEIDQEIQAVNPGTYTFPGSTIEGYVYSENSAKKRVYYKPKLSTSTEPVTINVAAFPTQGRPSTFNGAVGEYTFQTSLLTPSTVAINDKMRLAINIGGIGEISTVDLPDISILKSFFRMSDLPIAGEVKNNTKTFIVEIYPLSTAIKEIPALTFSFFNPSIGRYDTVYSEAIPIKVQENKVIQKEEPKEKPAIKNESVIPKAPEENIPPKPVVSQPETQTQSPSNQKPIESNKEKIPNEIAKPGAIEISGNYPLTSSDLKNLTFGTWNVMWVIPGGILIILLQIVLREYLRKMQSIVKKKSSGEIFFEAMKAPHGSGEFFQKLNQAFLLRLSENGLITNPEMAVDDLPREGKAGEVRAFLAGIEEKRFTGNMAFLNEAFFNNAKSLFAKINEQQAGVSHAK